VILVWICTSVEGDRCVDQRLFVGSEKYFRVEALESTCPLVHYPSFIPTFNYNQRIMASTSLEPPAGVTRPVVFFDINIGETPAGRIKIGTSTTSHWYTWFVGRINPVDEIWRVEGPWVTSRRDADDRTI